MSKRHKRYESKKSKVGHTNYVCPHQIAKKKLCRGEGVWVMVVKSFVVVFPSPHAKRYIPTLIRCIKRALKIGGEPYVSIRRDEHLILIDAHDPVFASAAIERLFGIEKILIARQTQNDYADIVKTTTEVGGNLLLGNERFLVQVEGHSKGFLPKDVEMAITTSIIKEKSAQGVKPGTQERYSKRLYVYMTTSNAYVSIFEDRCLGGLPMGVQGKAISCVFDEISAISCIETIRMGFETKIIALYKKNSEITDLAKILNKIIPYVLQKKINLTIYHVSPASKGFLNMTTIATELAINTAKKHDIRHIALPVSRIMLAGKNMDKLLDRIYDAGLNPIISLPDHERLLNMLKRLSLSSSKYNTIIGKRFPTLQLPVDMGRHKITQYDTDIKFGPNNIHDILDSMGQQKQT